MQRNDPFFREVWPAIGPTVTQHRAGAAAEVLPLLRRLRIRPGARVLDVPCGFGRHSILLARRGYRVTGVDINAQMLAQAREEVRRKGVTVDFCRGDMRRLRFRRQFDLVVNLFTSFGYFGDRGDQQMLEAFHRALRPGGWLALQTINRDFIVRYYKPLDRVRLPGFRLEQRARIDWPTSVIHGEWIVRWNRRQAAQRLPAGRGRKARRLKPVPRRGLTHLRVYSCHELVRMLEQAGFRRVQAFGGFKGEAVHFDRRWILVTAHR